MAINNIREYLIERLLDLDPSLSSRQGSLMFVKVINPLIKRLGTDPIAIDIESFLVQRLRDEFPELDVDSPGSALRDVLVSPLVLLMEPIRREVEFLRTQQSLVNARSLANEELDAILANVFSQRSLGDFARGTVRIYFSAPYNVGIDPTITFTSKGGLSFIPEDAYVGNIGDFGRSGRQYYLDIAVRSTVASSDHNVKAGDVNRVSGLRNVVRVANLTGFSGGSPSETNEEFLERAERSLSERSLNTKRGIETNVLNNFPNIVSVDVIGFGEDEMQRDILQGEVTFDLTEATGPMSYMTSDWHTHDLFNSSDKKRFPFTNTIILREPASGWSDKVENRITNAKYMRIADGESDNFDNRLLGRVRVIDQIYKHASGNFYIRTKDFEAYPKPENIYSHSTPTTVNTSGRLQGLNDQAAQGSAYKLHVSVDEADRVIGSQLPFTDIIETTFVSTDIPGSVIKGRDFLITASNNSFGGFGTDAPAPTDIELSNKIRAYPLTRFFNARKLGIGRVDSFMMSRDRYLYKGVDGFVFDPSLTYCAINETPKVIDFGAPKYSKYPSESEAYNGDSYEEGGRGPGVSLEGALADAYGPGTVPDHAEPGQEVYGPDAQLHEADLVLSNNQQPWDERGISIGDHVACSVYGIGEDYDFDGDVDNMAGNLVWYGVGKVKRIGHPDRWRLRLQGLDWTELEKNNHAGFAPSASAVVNVKAVGPTDAGSGGPFTSHVTGALSYNNHPKADLNHTLTFDFNGDGTSSVYLHATALDRWWNVSTSSYEPTSTIDSRSTVTISLDRLAYNASPPAVDLNIVVVDAADEIVCDTGKIDAADITTHDEFIEKVTEAVENSMIIDGNPGTSNYFLLEPNDDSALGYVTSDGYEGGVYVGGEKIVLRTFTYGNFANNNGWSLKIVEHGVDPYVEVELEGVEVGSFTEVPDRTPEALAGYLMNQANHQQEFFPATFLATAYIDPVNPTEIRFTSTLPTTSGNGHGVTTYDWLAPEDSQTFEIPEWDGQILHPSGGLGNINGGFSSGFGPLRQVKGRVPNDQLEGPGSTLLHFGDLENQGYERLELTAVSGSTNSFVAQTANRDLLSKRHHDSSWETVRLIIEFTVDGDNIRYVFDAEEDGELRYDWTLSALGSGYGSGLFSGSVVYNTGVITLKFESEDVPLPDEFSAFIAYTYYDNPYKVAWTVYRGSLEVLDSKGRASLSYDELSFAPALPAEVEPYSHHAGTSGFDGEGWKSGSTAFTNFTDTTSLAGLGELEDYKAVWIRLGKPFTVNHPSIGSSPSAYINDVEVVDTQSPERSSSGEPIRLTYLSKRYEEDTIKSKLSLPVASGSEGHGFTLDDEGAVTLTSEDQPLTNIKGLSGFLIPVPMGTYGYDLGYGATKFETFDLFEHQVVQLFEGTAEDFGDTKILVSGIPGSVPLPGITSTDLEIESDSIHIGGMTDVYIKPEASTTRTTQLIRLSPESIDFDDEDSDVVLQASDGVISPDVDGTHFLSAELEAELTNLYGPTPAYVDNLVLELVEPPSLELQPVFVRIIHTVPGGVKIDGEFPGTLGGGFENLRFRVMRKVTTSLNQPLEVLQQGNDLSIVENDFTVYFAGGIEFTTNPETTGMFLSIDSESGRGEYRVTGRNLNTLILDRVTTESGSGLNYRIYTKQAASVVLPLVRVNEVSISEDAVGIKVPYAKPIDIVGSSFAGLNDDPITEDFGSWEGGSLGLETVVINGVSQERAVFSVPNAEFKNYGVIRYDVLVLPELDEPLRHWYIDDIILGDEATPKYSKLVLDRSESLSEDSLMTTFIIGKPSIGTASVKFMDRTFFEAGPGTLFCYQDPVTDKKHYLRPSPAETSCVYKNPIHRTEIKLLGTDPKALVSTEDFFKYGVQAGDRVRLQTKVLRSDEFDGSEGALEHENLMLAGKTLAFKIENTLKTVTFTGPNPVTLTSAMNDINRQLGGLLRADISTEERDDDGDGTDEIYYRLMIYSSSDLEIVKQGTIGIVDELKFPDKELDNTPSGELINEYLVESVSYNDASSTSDGLARTVITLDESIAYDFDALTDYELLFIEIVRDGFQRVYPYELTQDASGLFSADIKLTSFEPNTSTGVVPEDSQLVATGYKSLGYHFEVENNNYSYSVGENVSLSCSSVILSDTAEDFTEVYEIAGAGVTISYDTSPTVDSIQAYMLSPNARVLCNNPLVRHYMPAYPFMTIEYTGDMSEDAIRESLSNLLSGLYPNLPLKIYDITSALARLGVRYLASPQEAGFIVHDADRNISVVRGKDIVALTKQAHIMEDMSLVTINKVG